MSSRYDDHREINDSGIEFEPAGPNWKKTFGVVLSIVLAVVVIGGGLIFYFGHNLINLANYVPDNEVQVVEKVEDLPEEAFETVAADDKKGKVVKEEELQRIHDSMAKVDKTVETPVNDKVYNIMLVGVDRRDKSWNGNSDSMMLVSVNYGAKRVSIVSLMRDTYVNIPDVGYEKLNNAYARGGGPLLTQTVSNMYNVDVKDYAAVDFENMIEIVDAVGGVDLEMTDAEVEVANGYMRDMCNTLGMDGEQYVLPGGGSYHCNGVQAVAYARNRFVGNSDYARTERQRYVISQLLQEIKSMNAAQLANFVRDVLPLVTHNLSESKIWDLVKDAPDIFTFKFVQDRIPYDGLYDVIYVRGQDMLVPDWEKTVTMLHDTIYGSGAVSNNYDNVQEDRTDGNDEYTDDYIEMFIKPLEDGNSDAAGAA